MRILSATESISPAIARTKLLLFKPFRPGRSWKLAATGYLGGTATYFLPFPLVYLFFIPFARNQGAPAFVIPLIVAGVAALMALYLVIFYLCSRLRFAFFDIVLNRGEFVAPAWRKYGAQSRKWVLFKIALGTAYFALLAIPCVPLVKGLVTTFSNIHFEQGQQPPPAFTQAVFSGYAAFFVFYFAIIFFTLLSSLLADFIVPSLALEDTTLAEAFRRVGRLVRNEPGAVCLYALIKIAIFLVGGMVVAILFYIFLLAIVLVAFLIGLLAYFLLHLLHVPQLVITVLAIVSGCSLYVFSIFYSTFLGYGALYTITESYALYFLGGRYPMLGDILDRTTPLPEPLPHAPRSGYVPLPPVQ
jgi:hypothetical protein